MKLPYRGVHLDFHTLPSVGDVGVDFDADTFADTLAEACVDFINVFAKCNLGMAYYPTRVGTVHPSLKRDLLGEMVEACHQRGIGVAAYLNAGLDHEAAMRHRDWAVLRQDGRTYGDDRLDHFFRVMCFGGPWADHLAGMIGEVLADYDVDGIWLDCWAYDTGCYGHECLSVMRDRGMDVTDHGEVVAFQNARKMDFVERVRGMIDEKRPEAGFFLNGIPYDMQLPFCSHLELESLPAGGWGYENFPWKVRLWRNLIGHVVGQTGRFHRGWGDFGGLRTQAGLDFDCLQAISQGAACAIGDHMHPRGRLEGEVYRRIGSIYRRIRDLEEWTRGARAVTDLAVIVPDHTRFGVSLLNEHLPITGATRALAEMHQQFDVLLPDSEWSGYRTLVLLGPLPLDEARLGRLRKHLSEGGTILSTGTAGMLAGGAMFPPEWGIEYTGVEPCDPAFALPTRDLDCDLPETPVTLGTSGVAVRAHAGTQVLADLVRPYFNRHWDGFHGHVYNPPDGPSGRPAITRHGSIIHFTTCIFSDYGANANPAHRGLVEAALRLLFDDPLVRVGGLPSFARISVTAQDARQMVHLLSYVPELRGTDMQIIEEPVVLGEVHIALRREQAQRVYLAPSLRELPWTAAEGRIHFVVPDVLGYQMVVVE